MMELSKHMASRSVRTVLFGATATVAIIAGAGALTAQSSSNIVTGGNTEPVSASAGANDLGFVFSVDGQTVSADKAIEQRVRKTDIALAKADVQISFDGLNPEPRLNIEMAGKPGPVVTLRSELNYPAYVTRGEFRIFDANSNGGARLLATVPVNPNGSAQVTLPAGENLIAVHRVYDANGRYDETAPLSLMRSDARGLTANDDGMDSTAKRNIRIGGGAVTVTAANVAQGATLYTMGETVTPDRNGKLVIQRILPPGDHAIDVEVRGGGAPTDLSRELEIPRGQWFYVASAELTYSGIGSTAGPTTTGRLSFYVDGETDNGVEVTASVDTGEGPIEEIFNRLGERDATSIARNVAATQGYPTFGDDSTIVDNTPTSGRFYVRVAQDGNFAQWGDYQASIAGSHFIRNERTLYGAQGHFQSAGTTSQGEARFTLDAYAAQPDQLVGRDVFRGTGGSVYFLQRSDVTAGTATVSVELRDPVTGRVVEQRNLVAGRDYTINDIQGVVTLTSPLQGTQSDGALDSVDVNLIVQYEYSPIGVDVDGLSYGGRAEAWVTDTLRIGVTALSDDVSGTRQTSQAADLLWNLGTNSKVTLDYARTEGPGFGSVLSLDGGLNTDTQATATGTGEAMRVAAQADFADLGIKAAGNISAYFENRTEGFSTLDYQVTAATGDETNYGIGIELAPSEAQRFALGVDRYETEAGRTRTKITGEADLALNAQLDLNLAAAYVDDKGGADVGTKTDLAARLSYAISDDLSVYGYAKGTVAADGLDETNRYGLGVSGTAANGWTYAIDGSGGTGGLGINATAGYDVDGNSTYFGYELDPSRARDAGVSQADNGGRFVAGGRRKLNDQLSVFGENTYDIFGTQRSLTSAYGVEYVASDVLTYGGEVSMGNVTDSVNGDFDRMGLSAGLRYADAASSARVRAEYRSDTAGSGSARPEAELYVLTANFAYKPDETQRFTGALTATHSTNADTASVNNGTYIDTVLGYAYRPVEEERMNVLAQLRYLSDEIGQTIDGVAGAGDIQRSAIASVDANYDIDKSWTIGGKLGYRMGESGQDLSSLVSNNAFLAVANARYHLVSEWDALLEVRHFEAMDAGFSETAFLGAIYRHVGENTQIGVGYNFGSFSDDLADLTQDDGGAFINIVASF